MSIASLFVFMRADNSWTSAVHNVSLALDFIENNSWATFSKFHRFWALFEHVKHVQNVETYHDLFLALALARSNAMRKWMLSLMKFLSIFNKPNELLLLFVSIYSCALACYLCARVWNFVNFRRTGGLMETRLMYGMPLIQISQCDE